MQRMHTLFEELIIAGYYDPDLPELPEQLLPGSFTPLGDLTPSIIPSDLSDLSEDSLSPRSTNAEAGSKEEVTLALLQLTGPASMLQGVTTRSQAKALQQAQLQVGPAAPTTVSAPQPTTSGSATSPTQQQTPVVNITALSPTSATVQTPAPQVPVPPNQYNPPLPPANTNPRMAFADLPTHSEHTAPSFDDSQPEELQRYFVDLEVLLAQNNVIANQERKQVALKYLKIWTKSLWKTTKAWFNQTKTYNKFKAEVGKLYLGASSDQTYMIQDLDTVIGHYACIGILNKLDLGEYYRRFLLISQYLISKNCLSIQEQSRSFFRGLQPQLEASV